VERLMRLHGLAGVHRRRFRPGRPAPAVHQDLVTRQFHATGPDRLWVTDITQHRTAEGWVYAAVVLDVFSRRVVGWSIADHLRTELVVDALDMARWRRKPTVGATVLHSDRGTQYTSWLFGHRLREAGLLGSMGAVGSAYDNALMESFFGSMQIELLDRRDWATRAELANAIFEWIEAFYNPIRRHSSLGYLSPLDYERLHSATHEAA
jgi:putative transposase